MSLCLTGALTLGGIAWLDNAIRGDEKQQIEYETEQEAAEFADGSDRLDNSEYIAGMELNSEEYDMAAASGNTVEEMGDTGLVNGNLMQEEVSDMDGLLDGMADDQVEGIIDENMNESMNANINENITGTDTVLVEGQENTVSSLSDITGVDSSNIVSENTDSMISEQILMDAGISFSDAETLLWPSAGKILIDYSMDSSVYFTTLNQYKYNPALIIGSDVGNQVLASTEGIVESVFVDEETGTTLVMNIGNGYKLTYGQLKELAVTEGDIVEAGAVLGYVSEPTKYYVEEGSNLYFGMTYEGSAVDPVLYLEG